MKKLTLGFLVALFAFVLVACAAPTFTVTFETNGGTAIEAKEVEEGSAFVQPSSPTRDGYVFNGWYADSAMETVYSFGTPVDADLTIYAGWTAIAADEFVVSFNSADGSYVAPVVVTDGDPVAEPTAPVRSGYTFVGWYLDDAEYDFSTAVTANITLVAHWDQKGVTDRANTYYTYISETTNLNPYSETLANASTLYSLISDALYEGDYDFEAAREQLVEAGVTDLPAEIGFEEWYAAGHTAEELPFNYFPAMASDVPVDVNADGTVWEISLKSGLQFVDGTAITAQTFYDSWAYLLDPDLLNARATNLYEGDGLPLVNAKAYFEQNQAKMDELGFTIYVVGETEYTRKNSLNQAASDNTGYKLYNAESGLYEDYYAEDWGTSTGWVLVDFDDKPFYVNADGVVLAPGTGYLDSNGDEIPAANADIEGLDTVAVAYAVAYPAYFDAEGNRADVDENGVPVDGETTPNDPVSWDSVGIEVVDEDTIRLTLTARKTQWQVMTQLSSAILSVVHTANYEAGLIEDGTRTTYGTVDNPLVAFGVYELVEWEPGAFFIFERNDAHYGADDYDIEAIRYDVISDQSVAVSEFIAENLDVTGVSGNFYRTYENSEYLKLSPVTTFFRFAFGLARDNDEDGEPDAPIMSLEDFRLALYLATDRETFVTDVNAPGYPTQSLLGPLYYSSEMSALSYRSSEAGMAVIADLSPQSYGFNPVQAKAYYDAAYAEAVTEGFINDGDTVSISFAIFDAETNIAMAEWLESSWEAIFGDTFDLVIEAVDSDTLDDIWDNGNFDLTFGGWQGLQFWAPQMLQVYSNVAGAANMLETGFETGNAILDVELPGAKVAVTAWLAELEALASPTTTDEEYIVLYEEFLDGFGEGEDADTWTGTYDYLWATVYSDILLAGLAEYEGNLTEYDAITAALESELLSQMVNIPLFTRVGASVYSSRIEFDADAYHARMGWGGLKYMSIAQEDAE